MLTQFGGMQIIADKSMVDWVQDWSRVRSPSRARRRLKLGHPQRIVVRSVPKPDVYQMGNRLIMHPEMVRELERKIKRAPTHPTESN